MLTFRQWQDQTIQALVDRYGCTRDEAAKCCDNWRWYKEHVQPAMKEGERPNEDVAKSLVDHCPYAPRQLEREFLSYGFENFWPLGYDMQGRKIQYTF
jgi:hypothetical protein